MSQPWHLYLSWGLIVGVSTGSIVSVLAASVSQRWFVQRRGLVVGLLTASTATGQLVFLPWLASVVTTRGWRGAPLIVAAATAVMVPVIWRWMRDRPEDLGLRAYGERQDGGAEGEGKSAVGAPRLQVQANPAVQAIAVLGDAVRVRDFWLLAGSFFVCGASTNGLIGTHLVSAAFDCGIPEVRSASLLAMMGLFDLAGTTASGWLSDRFNSRFLLFGYYGLRGLSLIFLPQALIGPSTGLMVFAVFYGLDWIATVPPTVRLCGEVFGRERASIVFGWVVAAHQVGAAFAAFGAGWLRTNTGAYTLAFMSAGALCLVAAVGVLPTGRRRAAGLAAC
jgi:sugar phosphate permease